MNMPRKVVITREDRDRVPRAAVRDDSKVRLTLSGRPRRAAKAVSSRPVGAPKQILISSGDRNRVLRAAVRDDSKVRMSPNVALNARVKNATDRP